MTELFFKDPREYIRLEHALRKARRPSYSMRAFARDLAISPSSLNDFMQSRIGMSEERIEKLATRLGWSLKRTEHFKDLVISRFDRDTAARKSALIRVRSRTKASNRFSIDTFKVISDWYHLAIRELCTVRDGLDTLKLAHELKLPVAKVKPAVERLIRVGLLKQTENGLKPDETESYFGDDGQSQAVKEFHAQILELAQNALAQNDSAHHDSQSFIYSVRKQDVEKMLSEIRSSVMKILNRYVDEPSPDCMQAITIQSFPLWIETPAETEKGSSKK